jgi:hypothetical protein
MIQLLEISMVIALTPDLEKIVKEQAHRMGKTAEEVVRETLRRGLMPDYRDQLPPPRDDWERRLRELGRPTGVSLTNEQLSRENIYED